MKKSFLNCLRCCQNFTAIFLVVNKAFLVLKVLFHYSRDIRLIVFYANHQCFKKVPSSSFQFEKIVRLFLTENIKKKNLFQNNSQFYQGEKNSYNFRHIVLNCFSAQKARSSSPRVLTFDRYLPSPRKTWNLLLSSAFVRSGSMTDFASWIRLQCKLWQYHISSKIEMSL